MFYAIYVPLTYDILIDPTQWPQPENLVFEDIKDASAALKRYKGSRMKTFHTKDKALSFLNEPEKDGSFIDLDSSNTSQDIVASLEKLSLQQSPRAPAVSTSLLPPPSPASPASPAQPAKPVAAADEAEPAYPSAKPAMLNQLRRKIEAGDYEAVEEMIWSNPRCLVSVSDSAIYLMAGPKYNACHIAARANKPDIIALILDTITNFSFLRKLYPKESDDNIQDRVNHLLDSYLNTPDPRQGNTPLHFASKLGHYRVVRVLLTFEGCDLSLRDSNGQTAEESMCSLVNNSEEAAMIKNKIKSIIKHQMHLPLFRDQLKKRLSLEKRRASTQMDADSTFSDIDESFILNSPRKIT